MLRRQIDILAFDEAQKLIRVYDELHAAHTAADGDCIKQHGGLVDIRRELLLHAHGRAAAADIAGRRQQVFHVQKLHGFIFAGSGSFFEV